MSMRLKNFLFCWLPLIIYCVIIYVQSDLPSPQRLPKFQFSDKVFHFVIYAGLGVLFYRAYQTLRIKDNLRMLMLLSAVSASLYGISDEIHQSFVPYRDASILDVLANILGAFCGAYLYQLYQLWENARFRNQKSEVRCRITDDR